VGKTKVNRKNLKPSSLMITKFIKGLNLLFGKMLNNKSIYITNSLNYLNRKREIDSNYFDHIRLSTLELVSEEISRKNLVGEVAELGVYKGKFAKHINQYFPNRKLFLFDTFNGFDEKDIKKEKENSFSDGAQDFSNTSIDIVRNIMPNPNQCIFKQGFFPETAIDVTEQFVFASIDTDLYDPIYNGLVFFYPKLVKGGYIFVHDFNNDAYKGARQAVERFCTENNIGYVPLPDSCGTAIICK
jgi:O-methyltransferase